MYMDGKMEFAARLRALRRETRLTQEELAELSGVSRATIGLLERKRTKPMPETLKLLAAGLQKAGGRGGGAEAFEQYLTTLFDAAGYPVARNGAASGEQRLTLHERLDAILRRHPDLGFAFATADGRIDDGALEFLVRAVETLDAEEQQRRRG